MKVTPRKVAACIQDHLHAHEVTPIGFANVDDPFNEVSKADPPDRAWYALASVALREGEEAHKMSFQVGEKDNELKVYCTWDYSIFLEDDEEEAS